MSDRAGLVEIPKKLRARENTRAPGYVVRRAEAAEGKIAKLSELAMIDHLTGIPNRRMFQSRLQASWNRKGRVDGFEFGVMLLDLRNFKFVNDKYGHQTGDQVLIAVAQAVELAARSNESVARIGGDEFAMELDTVTEKTQESLLARINEELDKILTSDPRLAQIDWMGDGRKIGDFPLRVNGGVASSDEEVKSWQEMLELADKRMYAQKNETEEVGEG